MARALGPLPPPSLPPSTGAPAASASVAPAAPEASLRLDTAMAGHIEAALARTHGRIEGEHGAALLLGINPHTLRARMRKLGVDWRRYRRKRGIKA